MRIKKNCKSCDKSVTDTNQPINSSSEKYDKAYADAIDDIKSAIHSLTTIAKNDHTAQEAIANLSVILMDLK